MNGQQYIKLWLFVTQTQTPAHFSYDSILTSFPAARHTEIKYRSPPPTTRLRIQSNFGLFDPRKIIPCNSGHTRRHTHSHITVRTSNHAVHVPFLISILFNWAPLISQIHQSEPDPAIMALIHHSTPTTLESNPNHVSLEPFDNVPPTACRDDTITYKEEQCIGNSGISVIDTCASSLLSACPIPVFAESNSYLPTISGLCGI